MHVVPLAELASLARRLGFYEVSVGDEQPYLRYYHVAHPDLDVYMFFNEHPLRDIDTSIRLPVRGRVLAYDAFANRVMSLNGLGSDDATRTPLRLSPYESLVVVAGAAAQALPAEAAPARDYPRAQPIDGRWSIALATAAGHPSFDAYGEATELADMSRPGALPAFSGTFRYATEFEWAGSDGSVALDLGDVYETAEVWLNGQPAGLRICPPYRLDVGALLRRGRNALIVEVTNTLVKAQPDFFSRFAQQEPSGLLGPVRLLF